jgi:osmotically-inducible protein OsmY
MTQRCGLIISLGLLLATAACARSDADVKSDVQAQLAVDPDTANDDLAVTVTDGVATISGDTRNRKDQERAVIIARAVKGVKDVKSQMKLGAEGIIQAVRDAIAADPMVARIPLTISMRGDGILWLTSGDTNKDERTRLVAIARGVEGVKEVVDDMH